MVTTALALIQHRLTDTNIGVPRTAIARVLRTNKGIPSARGLATGFRTYEYGTTASCTARCHA